MSPSRDAEVRRWQDEVARDPGSPAFVPLADHYRSRGHLQVARRVCTRGLERQPDHVEAHYLLGRIHRDAGELELAGDEWDITLRLDNGHVAARRSIAFLSMEQGDRVAAERHLRRALENDPDDPRIRRALQYLTGAARRESLPAGYWNAVGAHLSGPAEHLLRESRARLGLFIDTSGRILTRHGSLADLDLAGFATLAAGIHAAAREIARMLGQPGFSQLYQGHGEHQIFLGAVPAPAGEILLLITFGDETNIGLVRALFGEMKESLVGSDWPDLGQSGNADSLESSLAAGLDRALQLSGSGKPASGG